MNKQKEKKNEKNVPNKTTKKLSLGMGSEKENCHKN